MVDNPRILISEDDSSIRRVLARTFEQAGFDVTAASNGAEALAALERSVDDRRYDAMITDIKMPKMTGRELCEHLAEHGPYTPEVTFVVTSRSERDERHWVSELIGVHVIEKPVGPRSLLKLVKERLVVGAAQASIEERPGIV